MDKPTPPKVKVCEPLPLLLIDSREKTPLQFWHCKYKEATLQTGDYSAEGLEERLCIERKSVPDLAGSLTHERERFMREMHRANGFPNKYLLIIGTENELKRAIERSRGKINMKMIISSLMAIQARYGINIAWVNNSAEAALLVESWAVAAYREALKPAGVKIPFPAWITGAVRIRLWPFELSK